MMHAREQLPSGKTIVRQFNTGGQLTSEMHAYGAVEILLKIEFTEGTRTGETCMEKTGW